MDSPLRFFDTTGDLDFDTSGSPVKQEAANDNTRVNSFSIGEESIAIDPLISGSSARFTVLPDTSLTDGPNHGAYHHHPPPSHTVDPGKTVMVGQPPQFVSASSVASTSSSQSPVSRRKSKSTSATSYSPSEPEPPKKKRGRKPKLHNDPVEEEERRSQFLEKNRLAASKCRQKKKEYVSELEETKVGLEHENTSLHLEYNGLLGEVTRIKTQLMEHATCDDPNIDQWLSNEAAKFVRGTRERIVPRVPGKGHHSSNSSHRSVASTAAFSDMGEASPSSRRDSIIKVASPLEIASPLSTSFDEMTLMLKKEDVNYDHMPDEMF